MKSNLIATICLTTFLVALAYGEELKIVNVELGGHCSLGAAPVGPGGSWQVVEKGVKKVCPAGSSCRRVKALNKEYFLLKSCINLIFI
jgi:hypothetical protein